MIISFQLQQVLEKGETTKRKKKQEKNELKTIKENEKENGRKYITVQRLEKKKKTSEENREKDERIEKKRQREEKMKKKEEKYKMTLIQSSRPKHLMIHASFRGNTGAHRNRLCA